MHEFREWPKTTRLLRDITITEKLDGTNAGIHISAVASIPAFGDFPPESYSLVVDGTRYVLTAQSRKRIITPGKTTDNYGFAAWVETNAEQLVRLLGEGLHFGEWWGRGIQRGYGLTERRFSLFNVAKGRALDLHKSGALPVGEGVWLDVVPVLYEGPNDTDAAKGALSQLAKYGSVAAPGFASPEGICVYHSASRMVTKATLDNNDAGKWEV